MFYQKYINFSKTVSILPKTTEESPKTFLKFFGSFRWYGFTTMEIIRVMILWFVVAPFAPSRAVRERTREREKTLSLSLSLSQKRKTERER